MDKSCLYDVEDLANNILFMKLPSKLDNYLGGERFPTASVF